MCIAREKYWEKEEYGRFEWKRISEVRGEEYNLFHGIDPKDIDQGALGDCYLLSAIAALADRPERIMKLFEETEVNQEGIFCIHMNKHGLPVKIIVDDYIPWWKDRKSPLEAFSRGTKECWVQLIEKAYAKLHGCYDLIRSGWTHDAMRDLTGAPGWYYNCHTDDGVIELFKKARLENHLCFASTNKTEIVTDEVLKEKGLVGGHAYAVLDAK